MEQEVNKIINLTKFKWVFLLSCLKRYKDIFDVNLGEWTGPLVEIHIKEEAKPYHARAFPILVIRIESFKKYLDRLVAIGVLIEINFSEWAALSFVIPNKYGWVRFIYYFKILNKRFKLTPYPIPHIKYMLHNLYNFNYATTLNFIMD